MKNLDYIDELREAIRIHKDRVVSLTNMINDIRSSYKVMSPNQLNEAIRDVNGMKRELEEHRKFLEKAKKEVDTFYACPVVA